VRTAPGTYRLAPAPAEAAKPAEPEPEPDQAELARLAALERDAARKRQARERDRDAALARQAEGDRQLREQLIAACGANHAPQLADADLAPIRATLALGVSLPRILLAVKWRTENSTLETWRD
jgi:hypothetical protein